MKIISSRIFLFFIILSLLVGCSSGKRLTKQEVFPKMYGDVDAGRTSPISILVLPAQNNSTAADAVDLYNVTVVEELSKAGYYIFPLEVVTDILRKEGIVNTETIREIPLDAFKKGFGADAVLFITINSWNTAYWIIFSHVEVSLDFSLYSTTTNNLLWSHSATAKVSSSDAADEDLVGAIIYSAIVGTITKYITLAKEANSKAFSTLPVGPYHELYREDGNEKVDAQWSPYKKE